MFIRLHAVTTAFSELAVRKDRRFLELVAKFDGTSSSDSLLSNANALIGSISHSIAEHNGSALIVLALLAL